MKKAIFGLIAIVFLSFSSNAQISITHDDAKKIAVEHNNHLANLIKTNPTSQKSINNYFDNLKFENVSNDEKSKYFSNYSYDSNLSILKKYVNNSKVFEIINNCNLITENEKINLSDINNQLDKQIEFAKSSLSKTDLDVCLVYIEVLKKSGEFWLEKERGGSGVGYSFLNNNSTQAKSIPKGHKVLAADAMGASGALIIGALASPWAGIGAPAVFFGIVAASAAWSSGAAAIGL
jgi:hypothetical protein